VIRNIVSFLLSHMLVRNRENALHDAICGLGEWQDICTEFQRILFVRALRLDRISYCVTSFLINTLGARFVEPPVLDVKAVLEDSIATMPLIFVLSPGVDPTSTLLALVESSKMTDRFFSLSLGQGQSPIATQ